MQMPDVLPQLFHLTFQFLPVELLLFVQFESVASEVRWQFCPVSDPQCPFPFVIAAVTSSAKGKAISFCILPIILSPLDVVHGQSVSWILTHFILTGEIISLEDSALYRILAVDSCFELLSQLTSRILPVLEVLFFTCCYFVVFVCHFTCTHETAEIRTRNGLTTPTSSAWRISLSATAPISLLSLNAPGGTRTHSLSDTKRITHRPIVPAYKPSAVT